MYAVMLPYVRKILEIDGSVPCTPSKLKCGNIKKLKQTSFRDFCDRIAEPLAEPLLAEQLGPPVHGNNIGGPCALTSGPAPHHLKEAHLELPPGVLWKEGPNPSCSEAYVLSASFKYTATDPSKISINGKLKDIFRRQFDKKRASQLKFPSRGPASVKSVVVCAHRQWTVLIMVSVHVGIFW